MHASERKEEQGRLLRMRRSRRPRRRLHSHSAWRGPRGSAPWRLGEGQVRGVSMLPRCLGGQGGGEGQAVEVTVVTRGAAS